MPSRPPAHAEQPGRRERPLRSAATVLAIAWLCAVLPRAAAAEIIDRIVAVVDGQVITLSDVNAALRFGFVQPRPDADPMRVTIDELIERQLMLVEVERYGPPEPSAAVVEEALAAARARFESPSQLAGALAQYGMAEDQLRRRIRDDLRIRSYLGERFASVGQAAEPARREALIRDWIAGLRRRADVTVLYEPPASR